MTALAILLGGCLVALAAWSWSARELDGSSRLALVVVLGVTATAFNVVVPIPNVEATTTIVICAALALGAPTAIAVGVLAVIGTSAVGPIGAWTAWQIAGTCLVALLAAGAGAGVRRLSRGGEPATALALGAIALVVTVVYDVAVTVPTALALGPTAGSPAQQAAAALLLGIPFTVVHVVCTTSLSVLAGPSLIQALERARPRLGGGEIVAAR